MNSLKSYLIGPACALALTAWAHAANPTLLIYDVQNGAIQVIQDNVLAPGNDPFSTQNGGADSNSALNDITYAGLVGDWNVDITADIFGGNIASLDGTVTSENGSADPEELEVAFDADGFPAVPFGSDEITTISGTMAATAQLTYGTYTDVDSYATDQLGNAVLITPPGAAGPFGPGAYSGGSDGLIPASATTYSLVPAVDIQSDGVGGTSTFNVLASVPDTASTASLLGAVLLALCLVRSRRLGAAL